MTTMTLGTAFLLNPTVSIPRDTLAPFVDMGALQPFTRDVRAVSRKPYTGGAKFIDGDVLMARITPSLENGKTAIYRAARGDTGPAFGSTEFIVIRGRTGISDSRFAYYLVTSQEVRERAIATMNGSSGRQRVQHDAFSSFLIDLPSMEEQCAIADTLGALDEKIESNRRAVDAAECLGDQLFVAATSGTAALADVAKLTMGSSPPGETYNEIGDGLPFYQGIRDFGRRFPSHRVWTTNAIRLAHEGDSLVSVRAPVGELNRSRETCCIGRGVAAVSSSHPSTVFYALRAADSVWEPFQNEGTVFGAINKSDLSSASLPWPRRAELDGLESTLSMIDSKIASLSLESQLLASLRDSLLPELLSGRIRVTNAREAVQEVIS